MAISIQRFFLLIIGLLFCVLGCTREHGAIPMLDDHAAPTETHEPVDVEVAFAQNILPILTSRCALSGCHVADGPHGLDFRTYESFIAGGEHGPAFIPGNAEESEVVKQIVSGAMPPEGPPLSNVEVKLFVDWINQQESKNGVVEHEHSDEHEDEEGMHEDNMDDDDHGDDVHHEEDEHEDMDDDGDHEDNDN